MGVYLKTVVGEALTAYLPELARLRMSVFRDFPYLYEGTQEYKLAYLRTYAQCSRAAVVLAFDNERVIGASSCLPMQDEAPEFQRPFIEAQFDLDTVFYCGESVLEHAYRGQGLGIAFFEAREAHAKQLCGFNYSCFCAVERPLTHPLRPAEYTPLDAFWRKRGYIQHPELRTYLDWQDVDQPHATEKTLFYWLKSLS